jgi:surface carbohydrate biosynthesis protein
MFNLHLKECEFRFNHRVKDMYQIFHKLSRGNSLKSLDMNQYIVGIVQIFCVRQLSWLFSILLRLGVKERRSNGRDSIIHSKANNRHTILALDSDRYRGDLNVLSLDGRFRVLHIKQSWAGSLILGFYPSGIDQIHDIRTATDKKILDGHNKAVDFSEAVLKHLLSTISVDCVVTVNNRYLADYPWTLAFEKLNIPYIMLYREGLVNSKKAYDRSVFRNQKLGKFHGRKIIVQNYLVKKMFLESKIATKEQIAVCGALRMDNFIKKVNVYSNTQNNMKNKRKKFTLFYFPYDMNLFGKNAKPFKDEYSYAYSVWEGRKALFRQLHTSILTMAKNNPDIDFIIKPKREMTKEKSWSFYEKVVSESKIVASNLANYKVEPDLDAQQLIFDSDVICALQSTTVIESALAGKRVVLPLLNNYIKTKIFEDFGWKDHLHLFDAAKSKDEFESLVIDGFSNPTVSYDIKKDRTRLFEEYFTNVQQGAIDCYVNELCSSIELQSR